MNTLKLLLWPLAVVVLLLGGSTAASVKTVAATDESAATQTKNLIYFHGDGCPHCAVVDEWMEREGVAERYPIDNREVYNNAANALYYSDVMDDLGVPMNERGVPMLVVGDEVISGDQPIIDTFYRTADAYLAESTEPALKAGEPTSNAHDNSDLSLWVVISASLVDAINPCAFAVLIILLTAILIKQTKRTALASGLSFSAAIFISYMLMGLGLYSAITLTGATGFVTTIVGVLAILLGLLNLKDYFWYGKVTLIEVPRSWRPTMIGLIQKTTSPLGAFLIGFVVSVFLLPCTSGPYIVVLGLLAQNPLDATAIGYLTLYNIVFVLPMIIITLAAYKGLSVERLETTRKNNLKNLHLIAGIILLALGLYVLVW